jgi:hypothetical protein
VAVATNTHPGPWFMEDEATVITVVDILEKQNEAIKKARR